MCNILSDAAAFSFQRELRPQIWVLWSVALLILVQSIINSDILSWNVWSHYVLVEPETLAVALVADCTAQAYSGKLSISNRFRLQVGERSVRTIQLNE